MRLHQLSATGMSDVLNVPVQIHALMQDANHADMSLADAVDDDMRSDRISLVCRRQIIAAMAKLGVVADRLEGVIDLGSAAVDPTSRW